MTDDRAAARFEAVVLPHLDAAYNLARWLTRDDHDAADVVQEATLRAMRGFATYQGGDARAWLLTVVRNTCYTWLRKNRAFAPEPLPDDLSEAAEEPSSDPAERLVREADAQRLRGAIDTLPVEYREILVLRELEGLSYKQIGQVADLPIGTVMSRLSRARRRLQDMLVGTDAGESSK